VIALQFLGNHGASGTFAPLASGYSSMGIYAGYR
jgi:hypothetical protein